MRTELRLRSLLAVLVLATLLAGCGQKGPLVRPEPKTEAQATR
jgi:predicted small lipoprotein YifL